MTNKYDDTANNGTTVLDAAGENIGNVNADDTGARSHSARKRVAIAAGSVAVLAIGGCTAWAIGLFNAEDTTPVQVAVTGTDDETDDEDVIVDGVATVSLVPIADGFNENSSPFIAHIVGETAVGEEVDFYHAVLADGSTSTVELEQGEYEITWISAVNSDGSIYATSDIVTTLAINADDVAVANEAVGVEVETIEDNKDADGNEDASESIAVSKTLEVEQVFELIDADDVTDEDIDVILAEIEEAIANGDDTLTSANGLTIVEIVEENISTADDAADEVTSDVTTEETSSSSSTSNTASSRNSASSSSANSSSSSNNKSNSSSSSSDDNSSSSSSSNSSNNSSNSSSGSSSSNGSASNSSSSNNSTSSSSNSSNSSNSSSSTHNHSGTLVSSYYECKGCGAQFDSFSELRTHTKEGTINRTACTSYSTKHNYTCSCGATKQDW